MIRQGAIIAAGEGSRLRRDGLPMAKPMVPVAGAPLVEHTVRNFLAAGIRSLAVIVNEEENDCAEFLRSRFGESASLDVLVKTTPSSLVSFREVLARSGRGPDARLHGRRVLPPEDFVAFVREADAAPGGRPRPGRDAVRGRREASLGPARETAGGFSGSAAPRGDAVTAGLYLVPERVRSLSPDRELGRLRDFLGWLAEGRVEVFGVTIEKVIDVDRAADLAEAEALARKGTE